MKLKLSLALTFSATVLVLTACQVQPENAEQINQSTNNQATAALLSEKLESKAIGQAPDFVLIYKKPEALINFQTNLSKIYAAQTQTAASPEYDEFADTVGGIKEALVVANFDDQNKPGVYVLILNSDAAHAEKLKSMIEKNLPKETAQLAPEIAVEGEIITLQTSNAATLLPGLLKDSDMYKELKADYPASNVLIYLSSSKLMEGNLLLQMMMYSLLGEKPASSGSGFISPSTVEKPVVSPGVSNDVIGYLALSGQKTIASLTLQPTKIEAEVKLKLSTVEEMEKLLTGKNISREALMGLQERFVEELPIIKSKLEMQAENLKQAEPDFVTEVSVDEKLIRFNAKVEITLDELAAEIIKRTTSGSGRAMDARRKADINAMVVAVEQYAVDNRGKYPDKNICYDQIPELEQYFDKGFPVDPSGEPVKFGDITCEKGYYYQSLLNNQYTVWARVSSDGNKEWGNPDSISGGYYVGRKFTSADVGAVSGAETNSNQAAKPKVKRK